MKHLGYVALGLCILVFVLVTIVQYYTFNEDYYLAEYEKYDIYEATDLSEEGVLTATRGIIAYLKGDRGDLDLEYRGLSIFNNREIDHMRDVRRLFDWMNRAKLTAGLLIILIMVSSRKLKTLVMGAIYAGGLSLAMMGGLFVLMLTDFTAAFIRFHELFFSNDLWLLDPRTDRLIQMLPEGFFVDMGTMIVLSHLSIVLTIAIIAVYNGRKRIKMGA